MKKLLQKIKYELNNNGTCWITFSHESGKWYEMIITKTDVSGQADIHRFWGGRKDGRKGSVKKVETVKSFFKIINDRIDHGYQPTCL